ncbi:MAG: redox-regulated ATPase YchF [Vulcanimicrobiaceae bacterium]
MALACGIVGLPNVGKSTLFNALTHSSSALAANYPFATIDPNVGDIPLPDQRLRVLAEIVRTQKIVHASMRFVDIAGLVRGASTGAGLGNAFLGHIREVDALAMVVRCFEDSDVVHVEGSPDPLRDIEIAGIEMALADLATLAKRRERLEREVRAEPKLGPQLEALQALIAALEAGRPARTFGPGSLEATLAREAFLLTAKPVLYVANVAESEIRAPGPLAAAVVAQAAADGGRALVLSAKIEAELATLDEADAADFRDELGLERSGLDRLVLEAYELVGLMTFLTAGEKEVRAWQIGRGTRAPQAAGKIHSDIERGFIRAEIVSYVDYARLRSLDAARSAGLLRSEGKDYVMAEGDVVNFRFSV